VRAGGEGQYLECDAGLLRGGDEAVQLGAHDGGAAQHGLVDDDPQVRRGGPGKTRNAGGSTSL
jgi:hypothetical protein